MSLIKAGFLNISFLVVAHLHICKKWQENTQMSTHICYPYTHNNLLYTIWIEYKLYNC